MNHGLEKCPSQALRGKLDFLPVDQHKELGFRCQSSGETGWPCLWRCSWCYEMTTFSSSEVLQTCGCAATGPQASSQNHNEIAWCFLFRPFSTTKKMVLFIQNGCMGKEAQEMSCPERRLPSLSFTVPMVRWEEGMM